MDEQHRSEKPTRQMQLNSGELIDVTDDASEAGFSVPVAISRDVWRECVQWTDQDSNCQLPQHEVLRLWDVLWTAAVAAINAPHDVSETTVHLYRVPRDGKSRHAQHIALHIVGEQTDSGEPALTIALQAPSADIASYG